MSRRTKAALFVFIAAFSAVLARLLVTQTDNVYITMFQATATLLSPLAMLIGLVVVVRRVLLILRRRPQP